MKVALYTRSAVFSPQAVSEQLARLQAHAATNHFEVAGIYEDNGQSGMTLDRTGIQSLMADAEARKFDAILSEDLSRLSRNTADLLKMKTHMKEKGVRIIQLGTE